MKLSIRAVAIVAAKSIGLAAVTSLLALLSLGAVFFAFDYVVTPVLLLAGEWAVAAATVLVSLLWVCSIGILVYAFGRELDSPRPTIVLTGIVLAAASTLAVVILLSISNACNDVSFGLFDTCG